MNSSEPTPDNPRSHVQSSPKVSLALCIALVLVLAATRLIHLTADTPPDFTRISYGPYVDEGYKTSAARNRVLFGKTRWNPEDRGEDWSRISPLTTALYEVSFELFGTTLRSARLVTVVWFALFLLAVAMALRGRYTTGLLALLLAAFAFDVQMLTFSRIALLVIPLALLATLPLMAVVSGVAQGLVSFSVISVVCLVVATLGVKVQAPAYFVGSLAGYALWWWFSRPRKHWVGLLILAGLLVIGAAGGYVARGVFLERVVGIAPRTSVWELRFIFVNAMHLPSAFMMSAGYLSLAHLALAKRRAFREPYLCALAGTVVLGPLAIGVFAYDPIRYYAPLLPAFLLIIAEWFHHRPWESPLVVPGRLASSAIALVLAQGIFSGFQGVNFLVLERIPINLGRDPGLSDDGALLVGGPISLVLGFVLVAFAGRDRMTERLRTVIQAALLGGIVVIAIFTTRVFLFPTYESRELAARLDEVIEDGKSMGGDWAPFLALDTEIPALHISSWRNPIIRLPSTRPDYYLHSETEIVGKSLWRDITGPASLVYLGEPVLQAQYLGRAVRLYRLEYLDRGARPSDLKD